MAKANAMISSCSLVPLLVPLGLLHKLSPHGQAKACKRMQLVLHDHEIFAHIEYNRILFYTQCLLSIKILV